MLGLGILLVFLYLIFLGGAITVAILYFLNLQNTVKACQPQNQMVPPANVWLMFIPFFNIVYPFILYPKIAESVKRELESRGHREPGDYGKTIGILMASFAIGAIIPLLGILLALANIVLFIVFWVKMANYKKMIQQMPLATVGVEGRTINVISDTDLLDA